jgi:leucyl aminopeptidase
MMNCFETSAKATPIEVVAKAQYPTWLTKQSSSVKAWMEVRFSKSVTIYCLPGNKGGIESVLFLTSDKNDLLTYAGLAEQLPKGSYALSGLNKSQYHLSCVAWVMAAYRFTEYKGKLALSAKLQLPKEVDKKFIQHYQKALYLVRDLINLAPNDLMPAQLAEYAVELAGEMKAKCKVVSGEDLIKQNFPAIHAVGRASDYAPCLIDLNWGKKSHPKLTLVGKGVCYDTGGLSIKPTSGMVLMKKDMGGAAHVLGLASLIMQQKLPVQLRVLIPAVDNAIGGNAYRPSDVITMRNGKTVEVTNTDAEGRLVLADALALASEDEPDLIIDFATLTGAARVALGPDLPALFSNSDEIVKQLEKAAKNENDPFWRLPLHHAYRSMLQSDIADLVNSAQSGFAGAITAALFLEEFVTESDWVHYDLMAWNPVGAPGKPKGGEAMCLRSVFAFIEKWCEK